MNYEEYKVWKWADGREDHWRNGLRHRDDGPAIIFSDGQVAYYLNGEQLTEEVFNTRGSVRSSV